MIRFVRVTLLIGVICAAAPVRAGSDLEHAYRIIAAKNFVDLTHAFGPETPVWAGFGQAKFSPAADPKTGEPYTIAKDEFRACFRCRPDLCRVETVDRQAHPFRPHRPHGIADSGPG